MEPKADRKGTVAVQVPSLVYLTRNEKSSKQSGAVGEAGEKEGRYALYLSLYFGGEVKDTLKGYSRKGKKSLEGSEGQRSPAPGHLLKLPNHRGSGGTVLDREKNLREREKNRSPLPDRKNKGKKTSRDRRMGKGTCRKRSGRRRVEISSHRRRPQIKEL